MKKKLLLYLILIFIPYIVLLPYTFQILEVGNDFELYYFVYKKYIFELLKLGHFPLWSPVEASGMSLIFNPLSQYFYLPAWLFYLICLIIGEVTKYYFLIFTIFAISIFNLGLFFFLKTFKLDIKIILVSIVITCLSLKITELLRFPNAIHCFSWFPWILYGMNCAVLNKNFKKSFLIIFLSSLMILTAGYPYYIFYGLIIFGIYFIFLLINPIKKKIFHEDLDSNRSFFFKCFTPGILSLSIVSPWLLKISQLLSITYGRSDTDINFSLTTSSNIYDQLGSWIYPPFSYAEGWYYFGSISVFIIIVVFIYNISFNRNEFLKNYTYKYLSFFFIFLLFFCYQISSPENSVIFETLWNRLNFIQNFRHFVRFNVVLIPFLSLTLAFSITEFIKIMNGNKVKGISYVIVISFISILLLQINFIYFSNYENSFWETWQLKRIIFAEQTLPQPFSLIVGLYKKLVYPLFFILSFILIIFSIRKSFVQKYLKNKVIFLYMILFITFGELFFLTNIQWAIPFNYYNLGFEKLNLQPNYNSNNENALEDITKSFSINRVALEKSGNNTYEGNTYYRNNKRHNINHINNWGNKNHVKLFKKYFNSNGQFKKNLEINKIKQLKYFYGMDKTSKRIFFSKKLNYNDIDEFVQNSIEYEKNAIFDYKKISYDGDTLILDINTQKSGWVSFIDTWDHNWIVEVNDKPKKINKLFGAYKSVEIESGFSNVRFSYKPFNLNFTKN